MRIEVINPDQIGVLRLIDNADTLMKSQYPPQSNHFDDLEELLKPNVCFAGALIEDQLAGIGAVKILSDDDKYGEIKRVYVDTQFRRQKVAIEIMDFLETHLKGSNIQLARLETGIKQIEALGLYRKLGYKIRGPYGQYCNDPLSIFMEKRLIITG